MEYFEDWLFTSDAEIGPYNYFGMASGTNPYFSADSQPRNRVVISEHSLLPKFNCTDVVLIFGNHTAFSFCSGDNACRNTKSMPSNTRDR
jgi:hypothetical protein